MTKTCGKCHLEKPLADFYKRARSKDGLSSLCRQCSYEHTREWQRANPQKIAGYGRLRLYGITPAVYDAMLRAQGGVCAICGQAETQRTRSGEVAPLCVDHDHETGVVRGLLCAACNKGLGYFRNDCDRLRRAIDYLEPDV